MHKRLSFLLILPFIFVFAACNKSSRPGPCGYSPVIATAPASEVASLKSYLDANGIVYTQHSSGIFYQVDAPGAGATPTVCSAVTVKYRGRVITSSTAFDENTSGITFTLGQLIAGWQIGIPLIQKGGSIKLYIPPSLGYGNSPQSGIPANSNLAFNIELVNVQE